MIKNKKQMFIIIGAFALVLMLGTVTYAFFNYTRTGSTNTIKTGRIVFNAEQGQSINLTNLFPIDVSNGIPNDATKVGTVTIHVTGDTTYSEGIEYLVSAVNVNNTVGSKSLPISINVSVEDNNENDPVTTLGTSDENYFSNRGTSVVSSIYKVLASDTISSNDQLVVGYIKSGATGVDGNITVKAYLNASKILISDTYNNGEDPTDNLGTPASMGEDKIVFTTNEWNSLQTNGVSFQVKVEANEGIWVEAPDPSNVTPISCFTYEEDDNAITITGYDVDTCGKDVIIPKRINGLSVTTIGDYAFYEKFITSVILPSNLKVIEENAFYNNLLTSLTIPNSVTSIGDYAFNINYINNLTIPNNITYIGDHAFTNNSLSNIVFNTNSLKWDDVLPESVFCEYEYVWPDDSTKVVINNAIEIPSDAFNSCYISEVEINSNATTIGENAFKDNQLTRITLPNSLITIGDLAFSTNQLTSLVIPNSVTTIGESAFEYNQLTSVTIPNSVTSIGREAFEENNVNEVIFNTNSLSWNYNDEYDVLPSNIFDHNLSNMIITVNNATVIPNNAFDMDYNEIIINSIITSFEEYSFGANSPKRVVFGAMSCSQISSIPNYDQSYDILYSNVDNRVCNSP